ncbi:MAG: two-component system sensor histidine kinase NtrB [Thermodesulfobacteriota bacterium]
MRNVKWLMLSRLIILSLLLTITFLFQISEKKSFFIPMTNQFYFFVGLFYLVTIGYAFLLNRIKNLRRFTQFQLLIDHLFIAGLIYFTGGKESYFPITYIFTIIGSSILFYRQGAFLSASLSTLLYGLILILQLYRLINPLGEPFTYEASQIFYSLILYMSAFYIVAFLSSAISEELQKKKRELFQKQVDYNQLEAFNRNVIQSLDSGLLTVDRNGRINFLNRTAERILHRKEEELRNQTIYNIFPKIGEVIEEMRNKTSQELPEYQRYETILTDGDGRKIYLGFSISSLTNAEGETIGHTLIFQDITRFKEMEEQMKRFDRMAAIGSLAAGLAHEIRNPLASLSGSIQILKSELSLDESQNHLMEIILRESERLNALISDFLLFAQPPQTRLQSVEIEKILEETLELFTHSPSCHEGIRVIWPNSGRIGKVSVDPDQIRQVFWNLLINASQSLSNGGEIRIHIEKGNPSLWRSPLPFSSSKFTTQWVKISIEDTGVGIPPEEKEKIFEPFYTTKENGTGLGLSIVHKIIENHKGSIRVESKVGKGSTFTIFLPAG